MKIVVAGYMLRHPVAGNVLAYAHYVIGLHRLGHDVVYVEESGWSYSSYDPVERTRVAFPTRGLELVRGYLREHCPVVPVIYVDQETGRLDGCGSRTELRDSLARADLLINVGGVCWLPEFADIPRRWLVDMDPMFGQISGFAADTLDRYTTLFTYGLNVGGDDCLVPAGGRKWIPSVPPVVLDLWQSEEPPGDRYTTIANWDAYGTVTYDGVEYGQKGQEFLKLLDLPSRSTAKLEIALAGGEGITAHLQERGWSVCDGEATTKDVPTYREYVVGSRGEFSAAKHAYVATRTGWFSDRTACYLAAGRPAVVQDTGLPAPMRSDAGLLTFSTADEAVAALESVERDYPMHAAAARKWAREHCAHERVLDSMFDRALDSATARA